MEEKKNVQVMNQAGSISEELKEIRRMQEDTPYVLSIATNTCSGFYTLFCC